MSENLCKLHRDLDKYYSQNYLSSWCGQVKIEWTEFLDRAFRSIIPTILGEPNDNRTCLDIGCGPSISNVISASRYCNHITMADYLTSNRHEIEKFVQQAEDGFQWKHYFQFLGVLELDMNVDAIATRTRNAIKRIIFCDVTKEKVFEEGSHNQGFDIIIASLVFDVVAINSKMYKQALSNVLQYLVSDGVIIIHGSIGEHTYTVGSAALPAMEATEDMLMKIFHDLNLKIVRWEICVKLTTHYYCILRKK